MPGGDGTASRSSHPAAGKAALVVELKAHAYVHKRDGSLHQVGADDGPGLIVVQRDEDEVEVGQQEQVNRGLVALALPDGS
jgi:hypothetical protein